MNRFTGFAVVDLPHLENGALWRVSAAKIDMFQSWGCMIYLSTMQRLSGSNNKSVGLHKNGKVRILQKKVISLKMNLS